MPKKYHIHTQAVPPRFKPITRSGVIAWEEGCLKCPVCVKKKCVYGVYEKRSLDSRQMLDSLDTLCMNCLRCVQNCPKELIHKSFNPEFMALGDAFFRAEIISRLWYQAETGKIPVSGAGYPGPFSGPGFDSMWTDMSEIVRPTRDGIHGREYISTAVDLGRNPAFLSFDNQGRLLGDTPEVMDIPLPILLKVPSFGSVSPNTLRGWAMAAKRLGTFLHLEATRIKGDLGSLGPWLFPSGISLAHGALPQGSRMVEIPWSAAFKEVYQGLKERNPSLFISVKLAMGKGMEEALRVLVKEGVSVIHLETPMPGEMNQEGLERILAVKEGIRSAHKTLLETNLRDRVTLLVSGGMAMAEHVAKAIICGADAVLVDFPILIALECRMCRRCLQGLSCPVEIEKASPAYVARRVINLMGAWHSQLLEVMGAMGMRDARRLRGDVGRAIFFEESDQAAFGNLGGPTEGCDLE